MQAPWEHAPDSPGTRLHWRFRVGISSLTRPTKLTREDGTTVALLGPPRIGSGRLITADGVTFECSSLQPYVKRWLGGDPHFRNDREVVRVPSKSVLFRTSGGHYDGRAETVVTFPDSRSYGFPVSSGSRDHAVMRCMDEQGTTVAHYRYGTRDQNVGRHIEIAISDGHDLTDELVCVMALSPTFLLSYFGRPSGG